MFYQVVVGNWGNYQPVATRRLLHIEHPLISKQPKWGDCAFIPIEKLTVLTMDSATGPSPNPSNQLLSNPNNQSSSNPNNQPSSNPDDKIKGKAGWIHGGRVTIENAPHNPKDLAALDLQHGLGGASQ